MSSSPALEAPASPAAPSPSPSNPALRAEFPSFQTSTPNYIAKKQFQTPLSVSQPPTAPATPPTYGSPTLTPPPRSPGALYTPASGDARSQPGPDGTSSDKSSENAAVGTSRTPNAALSRKESYKAQRQHYRREKKRAATALLHSIEDPAVVVLADWLKVRGSLKSWTKLWCVLKPGLLLLYKSPKAKSSHWVGTVLLTSCQVIERPSKKDGFCFKLYHPLEQSIWAPRGPHNETIGAVVQPLPTAHLIFRAPSQAAGHCWLDGLELALVCTNAMLRCSSRKAEQATADVVVETNISHEELEKHFNEHELLGATDSESDGSRVMPAAEARLTPQQVLARLRAAYLEDPDRDVGQAGELVEEVNEENKSLLWFLLKQVRPGMDLSKVVLPTFILEPRSFLDKLSDTYYHSDILQSASMTDDPYLRFLCVLRWYLSGLYKKPRGLKKPYNPVLGEVFRCCWSNPDGTGYTFYIAEQVSHHPPVTAFYVTNRKSGFVVEGSLLARSKFYGNSTSAILEGTAKVHLLKWNETYFTTAPYAHCKGIVIGTLSMELGGKIHIACPQTGYHADVEFKLRSFLGGSDQTNAVYGRIKKGKDTIAMLEGYWDGRIEIKDKKTGEESNFIDVNVLKEQRLTRYLMSLELQEPTESQKLWLKVSEAIANEDLPAATEQKTIIEEAQRERARSQNGSWVPRLFSKDADTEPPEGFLDHGWVYNYKNLSEWQPSDQLDYEEEFQVKSLTGAAKISLVRASIEAKRDIPETDSSQEAAPRQKRTIKQSLQSIDSALHSQATAIEKLSRNISLLTESQRHAQRTPSASSTSTHSQDLLIGFVCAIVLQAILSWLFVVKQ